MTDNITEKDKKDWENFLSKKEKLPNKDIKIDKKITFKIKSIDLHGYTLDEANKSIESFIIKSYQENINKLVVVTGKGTHSQNEKNPYALTFDPSYVFASNQGFRIFFGLRYKII